MHGIFGERERARNDYIHTIHRKNTPFTSVRTVITADRKRSPRGPRYRGEPGVSTFARGYIARIQFQTCPLAGLQRIPFLRRVYPLCVGVTAPLTAVSVTTKGSPAITKHTGELGR